MVVQVQEELREIEIDKIVPDENQPRKIFEERSLQGLASSIEEVGILQPPRVRKKGDKFVLVDGERRIKAKKLLGHTTAVCIVEGQHLIEGQILHRQIISDCQKESFSPVERANALDRLKTVTGWTVADTAKRTGFSTGNVSKYLAILKLPPAIQDLIGQGAIPWSAAPELAAIEDATQQSDLAQKLADGRLTRDGLKVAKSAKSAPSIEVSDTRPSRITATFGEGQSVSFFTVKPTLDGIIELAETFLTKARAARRKGRTVEQFTADLRKDAAKAKGIVENLPAAG